MSEQTIYRDYDTLEEICQVICDNANLCDADHHFQIVRYTDGDDYGLRLVHDRVQGKNELGTIPFDPDGQCHKKLTKEFSALYKRYE